MKTVKKIGAVLAFFIGAMSVFEGSKVLFGIDAKDYNVLTGLVTYNVAFGVISIIAAYFLWKENNVGKMMMWGVLSAHFMVFLYLQFFSETVADESKMAMIFRISIWLIIVLLSVVIPKMINKKQAINLK